MIGLNVWEHRRWIQQNSGIWLKAAGYLQALYILPVKIIFQHYYRWARRASGTGAILSLLYNQIYSALLALVLFTSIENVVSPKNAEQ